MRIPEKNTAASAIDDVKNNNNYNNNSNINNNNSSYNVAETLDIPLEKLLEDVVFVQFFNAFLSLHVFGVRLLYNPVTQRFEEFANELVQDDAIVAPKSSSEQRTGLLT